MMVKEADMDFRIPGLPHSVVKHAQSTSVRELIQKIDNHYALQQDLRQNQSFNPFSPESKQMIRDVGNIDLWNSRRNPKRSAKRAYLSGISAWSIARAGICCTKKHAHFFLVRTPRRIIRTFLNVVTPHLAQGEIESASFSVFPIHLVAWCRYWMSRSSASLQSSPHQQHSHPDLQRPPHPWQEVSAQAQARPLAVVSQAEWLIQPQTQIMGPSSPTSSAAWIWSTRRSISRQPPQFHVPRRRHRDSHQSRRFTDFRSIQQQQANNS